MVPRYILDTRLSRDHYVLCTEAIRREVIEPEDLNEGRRTMPEQWHFWRNQPPLAAFPSPNAPHIWAGRNNHAIDSNSRNGASQRLAKFYRGMGVAVSFNVPGENWHFQPGSGAQLKAAAARILARRDAATFKKGERESHIKFFKHQLHFLHDPQTHKPYFRPEGEKPKEGWDPTFNDELRDAVKAFQRDHNLRADGVIGPQTERKIDRVYSTAKRRRKSARLRAKERSARVSAGEKL
jgi:hypothetical protein